MEMNIVKTFRVNETITFSKEEKEAIKKVHLLIARITNLKNELNNHENNFAGYLRYGTGERVELSHHLEDFFDSLDRLKYLESISFEYDEPQTKF